MMFYAINQTTGERVWAVDITKSDDYFYGERWYAPPESVSVIDGYDKSRVEVKYNKGADEIINYKGTRYSQLPHFFIAPENTKFARMIRNRFHSICADTLYQLTKSKKIRLTVCTVTREGKSIPQSIDVSCDSIDYTHLAMEGRVTTSNTRIADILIPFKEFHPFLGFGVMIEIQLTEQRESDELSRSYDRANRGYSLCWLTHDDFIDIHTRHPELKSDCITIVDYGTWIKKYNESIIDRIKEMMLNYTRVVQQTRQEILDIRDEIKAYTPVVLSSPCSSCGGSMVLKKGTFGQFYGCTNYPLCKKTIRIP